MSSYSTTAAFVERLLRSNKVRVSSRTKDTGKDSEGQGRGPRVRFRTVGIAKVMLLV